MKLLQIVSLLSIITGGVSLLVIVIDLLAGHPQKMWIMNVVWPVTGLYAGPLALAAYYTIGRKSLKKKKEKNQHSDETDMHKKPFWQSVLTGTLHCGSGCTLGDITAEFGLLVFPFTVSGSKLYGGWVIDYIVAFFIGIGFQYYAIKPMRNLSPGKRLLQH